MNFRIKHTFFSSYYAERKNGNYELSELSEFPVIASILAAYISLKLCNHHSTLSSAHFL